MLHPKMQLSPLNLPLETSFSLYMPLTHHFCPSSDSKTEPKKKNSCFRQLEEGYDWPNPEYVRLLRVYHPESVLLATCITSTESSI